jgi:hypothetical protein
MGEFRDPPNEYFISEAAKELGMSYAELEAHPERERLMKIAFTLTNGRSEGEHALQCTKAFWKLQKDRQDEIDKTRAKVFKAK